MFLKVICDTSSGSLCFLTSQKSQQIVHPLKPGVSVYKDTLADDVFCPSLAAFSLLISVSCILDF